MNNQEPNYEAFHLLSYSKEIAIKSTTRYVRFMLFIGAVTLSLKEKNWKTYYRWFHPATWIVIICFALAGLFYSVYAFMIEYFAAPNKKAQFTDAPKRILVFDDFVAEPLNNLHYNFALTGDSFNAKKVIRRSDGLVIEPEDFIETGDLFKEGVYVSQITVGKVVEGTKDSYTSTWKAMLHIKDTSYRVYIENVTVVNPSYSIHD